MKPITLYRADCRENKYNTVYPHKVTVCNEDDMRRVAGYDHVFAAYKSGHRSLEDFIRSDCLPFDCDNEHSEDPAKWKTPSDVAKAFPGVPHYIVYSRHHMKPKGKYSSRPRFHIIFPIEVIESGTEYGRLKESVVAYFSFFDSGAKDSARFFFGVENPVAELIGGETELNKFMADKSEPEKIEKDIDGLTDEKNRIQEGMRNSTMSHFAGKVIKRYGNTEEAKRIFLERAESCDPPLSDTELETIWKSAEKFGGKVSGQDGYIPPEEYNSFALLKPTDYSDVAQATVFAESFRDTVRYSPSTDYLVYNGTFWEESPSRAQAAYHRFTDMQLKEAKAEVERTNKLMTRSGASVLIASLGKRKAESAFNDDQWAAYLSNLAAKAYLEFVIGRRDSKYVSATLREARPMVEIDQSSLDADPYLLNTPGFTIDLRKGMKGLREHRAEDFITKCTSADPGTEGEEMWADNLHRTFCGDCDLERYAQDVAGITAVGQVHIEAMQISYGSGKNGKSTFWNAIASTMGTYSGHLSADALTVGCKRNVKPELAEAKGKRLIIASELEEGMRLNTATVKQFCSTDEIFAEKKYKAPFSFIPSHTLILYTNHLPKVGANDFGNWRRLIVMPFNAVIDDKSDIKNYAAHLCEHACPAILKWMIEGAERIIKNNFHLEKPECVLKATEAYRESSNWLEHFIEECCEIGKDYSVSSGDFYQQYRSYCAGIGDYARSTADFYTAVEYAGYERKRTANGRLILGLRLKPEFTPLV